MKPLLLLRRSSLRSRHSLSLIHIYILSGEGSYNDGEKSYPVKAGDVTFCPDGTGHALDNTGDTDLVFMALIIMK